MSYFIAIYGAGLALLLLRFATDEQQAVLAVVSNAGLPAWLPLAPLFLCTVAILFFPVQLSTDPANLDKPPTPANVAVLVINAWTQKTATFTFAFVVALTLSSGLNAGGGLAPEPDPVRHTVERGDSLSRLAKRYCGDALKYQLIFEANTDILRTAERIEPGQTLSIPCQVGAAK